MRVVIADDHPLFLEGVAAILDAEPGIDVVGRANTADDAKRVCADQQPDLVIMDVDMPGDSIAAVQTIRDVSPASKVVMLTVSQDTRHIFSALKAGAHGYVVKGVGSRELVRILRAVYEGESYVSPALAGDILSDMARTLPLQFSADERLEQLTEREKVILRLLAEGRSNREIGQELYLTEKTIKQYVTAILQKLHVRNRVEAASLAYRAGLANHEPS